MSLYKKCFEIASFLDGREPKDRYLECLGPTPENFRKFAKMTSSSAEEDLLKEFQGVKYLEITKFVMELRKALR
jgi:hypothetical protein